MPLLVKMASSSKHSRVTFTAEEVAEICAQDGSDMMRKVILTATLVAFRVEKSLI